MSLPFSKEVLDLPGVVQAFAGRVYLDDGRVFGAATDAVTELELTANGWRVLRRKSCTEATRLVVLVSMIKEPPLRW